MLEVRDQRRIPGLDEAAGREVLDPADVGAEEIRLETGVDLRESVRLVAHVGEPRLVLRMGLHVLREHGLASVVSVAGPVQHLEPSGLLREVRARGPGQSGSSGDQSRAAGDGRQLEQVFTAEPPLQ